MGPTFLSVTPSYLYLLQHTDRHTRSAGYQYPSDSLVCTELCWCSTCWEWYAACCILPLYISLRHAVYPRTEQTVTPKVRARRRAIQS